MGLSHVYGFFFHGDNAPDDDNPFSVVEYSLYQS